MILPGKGCRAVARRAPVIESTTKRVHWCLHCETVFRAVDPLRCPSCGAGYGDVWLYHDSANDMPPAHWPDDAPPDGTRLSLNR